MQTVEQWMTRNPHTIEVDASIIEAMHLMKEKDIRRLPVTCSSLFAETFFVPDAPPLKAFWIASSAASTVASSAGWLTSQSFCGARRMRAPFAPPRLSLQRNVDADAQAVVTSWEIDRPDARIVAFRAAMSCASINA